MPSSSTTSLKLDIEMKERVQHVAAAQRRSSHWIMREAIAEYVTRAEKRQQFKQDALDAWAEYERTGLHVTEAEADAWLTKLALGEDASIPECHT
jgi:predicted transcriptional regulator